MFVFVKSILSKEIVAGIIGLTILLLAGGAGAKTLTVDDSGGADFLKIQDAINYASAGDTILVYSGTYQEKVVVTKPLILKGIDNGGGRPVVKAMTRERPDEIPIALSSGSVTIDGFRTESGRAGIYVVSKNNVIINNTAFDNEVGIYLKGSSNSILKNNTALNNKYGILLGDSSNNNTVSGNIASNNDYGIYQVFSSNNTLSGNNVTSNILWGIYLAAVSNNTIYNNLFNNDVNFVSGGNFVNRWNITKAQGINIAGGPNLGGNFWVNPTGTGFSQTCPDDDNDGICDSPYDLGDLNNIDYLPLAFMPTATKMTLTVDDSGRADYSRIQDAINNARSGATILVYSGIYNENVIVNKPIILKGIDNGWGRPIIKSITLSAGNSTFDGFRTISGDYSPVYKPFTTKLVNLALIISVICTIVIVYFKKDMIRAEIASASINVTKGAIKDLIIGSIKGIFVGFMAGVVISQIMIYLGFFAEDRAWTSMISMILGALMGLVVGAIAGMVKDAIIGAIAGAIFGVVFQIRAATGWTIFGEFIGVAIIGAIVGSLIGRVVLNSSRKSSMNGAIIGGVIGYGGLFESMSGNLIGSAFIGIVFGSFIGGFLGLLAGRVTANKKAIPKGAVSGLIGSAIACAITGIFFQGEALYISFIVSLVAGAIIGGTICLYFGASKYVIFGAFIGGIIAGSTAGLIGGGIVVDWILMTKQKISQEVLISGSIGAVVGGIVGALQTRKNVILESAVAGSIGAEIGGIAGYIAARGSTHSLIVIPIAGAIVGGLINKYYGRRKYAILFVILGGIITGIILGIAGGVMRF